MRKPDAIWCKPSFIVLWVGSFLSALADGVYYIVLAWFVLHLTHSAAELGTALFLAAMPRLIFMTIGGVAIDRVNPKIIMLISLLARGGILVGVEQSVLNGLSHIIPIDIMPLLFGVVDAFYWPTQNTIVPYVVESDALIRANALVQTSQQLSMVVGPLLAGMLLIQMPHFTAIFIVIAIIYGIAGLFMARVDVSPATESKKAARASIYADLMGGFRYVFRVRILLFLMLASMLINLFFMGPANIGLPSFVQEHGWSGAVYGYFESALGLGAVVGGILVGLFKGFRGHFRWIALTASGIGMGLVATSIVSTWTLGVMCFGMAGVAMSLTDIPIITYVQTIVDKKMLGRVMSLLTFMSVGLTPVSYMLSAFALHNHWLSPQTLMFMGGTIVAIFCAALIGQRDFRTMELHPAWQEVLTGQNNQEIDI